MDVRLPRTLAIAATLALLAGPVAAGGSPAAGRTGLEAALEAALAESAAAGPAASASRAWVGSAPPPLPLRPADDDAPVEMQFVCPTGQPQNTDPTDRTVVGCPIRVYDTQNPFGNPALRVHPDDPRMVAFFALHGGATTEGPHDYSRVGQTHTTFSSADQGISWDDQPTGFPEGSDVFGETAAGTMDDAGNQYIAYLWSRPGGNATWHGSVIGLYKAGTPADFGSAFESYDNGHYIEGRGDGNPLSSMSLVHVPAAVPPPPPADDLAAGNATQPSAPGEEGEAAVPDANGTERIAVVWHERARDWKNSTSGHSAWIEAAFTHTGGRNNWTRMRDDQLVGPCQDASNAVAWRGDLYVACVVEAGYGHRPRARIGDVDVWRIDGETGNSTQLSYSGLRGGHPQLAVNPDGYMLLVTAHPFDPSQPLGIRVEATFGWFGTQWNNVFPLNLGPTLHQEAGDVDITDAHVTAIALSEDDKTALLVYKERQVPTAQEGPPALDPQNPPTPEELTAVRLTEYQKIVVSFNECANGLIAGARMGLGTGLDAYQIENYLDSAGAYNDVQDGLQAVRDASGAELFYFAINDYGAMQYGAIDARTASSFCAVTAPIPAPLVAPVPQALTVSNPATLVLGAAVGTVALAMVTYLLTVKRRAVHALATKAK